MTDYHDFTTVDTPHAERKRLGVGDIWSNEAQCLRCQDTLRSRNRHDFVTCRCGGLSVDGGSWYLKRNTAGGVQYLELSVPFSDVRDESGAA